MAPPRSLFPVVHNDLDTSISSGGVSTPSRFILEHPTTNLTPSLSIFGSSANPAGMSEVNPFDFSFSSSTSAPRPPSSTSFTTATRKRLAMDPSSSSSSSSDATITTSDATTTTSCATTATSGATTTTSSDAISSSSDATSSPPSPPSVSASAPSLPSLPSTSLPGTSLPLFTPNTEKAFSDAFAATFLPLPSPPSPLLAQTQRSAIVTNIALDPLVHHAPVSSSPSSPPSSTMAPQDLTLNHPIPIAPNSTTTTTSSSSPSFSPRRKPAPSSRQTTKGHRIIPSKKFIPPVIRTNRPPLPTVKSSDFIVSDGVRILPRLSTSSSSSSSSSSPSSDDSSFLPSPTSSSPSSTPTASSSKKRSKPSSPSLSSPPSKVKPSSPSSSTPPSFSSSSSPPPSSSPAPSASEESEEEKRQRFLERNRIAASKCRQKKKAWIRSLEEKAESAQKEHDNLRAKVSALQQEVAFLRGQLTKHHQCSCSVIHEYASAKHASMSHGALEDSNGGPIPTGALEVTATSISPVISSSSHNL